MSTEPATTASTFDDTAAWIRPIKIEIEIFTDKNAGKKKVHEARVESAAQQAQAAALAALASSGFAIVQSTTNYEYGYRSFRGTV